MPSDGVKKVESTLNITDEVIRYLITKPDLKAIAKAEEAKAEKAKRLQSVATVMIATKKTKSETNFA